MAITADLSGNNPLDRKYGSPNRTSTNVAAIVALTPLYPGEIVLALDTGLRYRALGPTAANGWGHVSDRMN
jgi:1,6-anhydro-N-acetylmuramate kinase